MHTPTDEQAAIVSAASESDRNLLVSALAGAAKTSTLELIAAALPGTEILALAFNKAMALEMQERMPPNVKAMTLNALGHRTWMDATGRRLSINSSKTYEITSELIKTHNTQEQSILWERFTELLRIVDFGKACGYVPSGHFDQAKALMRDGDFFPHLEQKLSNTEIDLIRAVSLQSLHAAMAGNCDYNDQILMPTVFHGAFPRYPLVLVDEAQDLSRLNHATLRKLVGKRRTIAVGDQRQCQPAGTKVLTGSGELNIEDLQTGQKVIVYHRDKRHLRERLITGKAEREYSGRLLSIITETNIYEATPNHRCVARLNEDVRGWHAVYLMQKGSNFRVGKTALFRANEREFGLALRARQEKADAIWLLEAFETKEEALATEQVIASNYGIPDICFINSGELAISQERLDWCWDKIGDNIERALPALKAFGRELEYPIWFKGCDEQIAVSRQCLVRACNLDPNLFEVPIVDEAQDALVWKPIEVRQREFEGKVYSLEIEKTESTNWNGLYISNGILTGNSIYGFRGAHEESMSLLREEFDMQELPLTISFCCPRAVVRHVHWRAPQMRWPEWAKGGEIRTLTSWTNDTLPDDAVIICRNNAPLFAVAIKLLKTGRSCELHGRDVVASITKVMRKFGGHDLPQHTVLEKIEAWLVLEMEKNKVQAHKRLTDRAECMKVFALEGATLGDALAYAQHLSQLRSPLKLMTGHGAKGLEFDHVYFLDQHLIGKDEQEPNLRYVICTRARETLTYIRTEDFVEAKEIEYVG